MLARPVLYCSFYARHLFSGGKRAHAGKTEKACPYFRYLCVYARINKPNEPTNERMDESNEQNKTKPPHSKEEEAEAEKKYMCLEIGIRF